MKACRNRKNTRLQERDNSAHFRSRGRVLVVLGAPLILAQFLVVTAEASAAILVAFAGAPPVFGVAFGDLRAAQPFFSS